MSRKIDDAGEIMLGARKHEFGKGLRPSDLDGLSDTEAAGLVTKDNVWPLPDYKGMIAAGRPPILVALTKILRDRMPRLPYMNHTTHADMTGMQIRLNYMKMLNSIRILAEGWESEDQAKRTSWGIYDSLNWSAGGYRDPEMIAMIRTIQSGNRTAPFDISDRDISKARKMLSEGFPEPSNVPVWKRGLRYGYARDHTFYAIRGKQVIVSGAANEDELDAMLEKLWREKKAEKRKSPAEPPRRPQGMPGDRDGMPDHRQGRNISPEEFLSCFGFRGIQFGESLPDVERQAIVNHAYDSLKDLAFVLDVEDEAISLYGRLGAAFGARGKGNASAHYEPHMRLFNITRERGAGSLAHEWAHGFDDVMGEILLEGRNKGSTTYASAFQHYNFCPEPIRTLWYDTVRNMISRKNTRDEEIEILRDKLEKIQARKELSASYRAIEMSKQRPSRTYLRKLNTHDAAVHKDMLALSARLEMLSLNVEGLELGRRPSNFIKEAAKLCGKTGEYWKRRHELFARAFESAVFDVIAEKNGSSPFLVHGVEEDRYAGDEWKGNPYPAGDERTVLRQLIPSLVNAGLHHMQLTQDTQKPVSHL